ncbi:MAG: ubiquitin-like domain-containing protein [Candidatus Helarchaeota archaeon]
MSKVMTVRVRMTDGSEERFMVPKIAKIREIKQLIEQKRKIPMDRQRLVYGGKVLDDSSSLKSLGFQNEGVIFCVVRSIAGLCFGRGSI